MASHNATPKVTTNTSPRLVGGASPASRPSSALPAVLAHREATAATTLKSPQTAAGIVHTSQEPANFPSALAATSRTVKQRMTPHCKFRRRK
mmetsp:Transcript_120655/g.341159  ORF Transcript_120655/g.341159 Transcript_120655/m.341159 type:complete len:92 (-) Transcript_120655:825-1100(-)